MDGALAKVGKMLIHNARVIQWEEPAQVREDCAIVIEDGVIQEVGPSAAVLAAHPEAELLDAGGQYVLPANICAHTHFYGAFARGMAIPGRAPDYFPNILRKLWWPLDKSLDEEGIRFSTLVCLIDAIRHGTTTLIDHHASPSAIPGSLDIIAEAVEQAGVRAGLCYEVTDRGGEERAKAGIAENVRFIERCRGGGVAQGRVAATFGLHASLTLSAETLDACRAAAPEGAGFHLHVAEHEADQYDSLEKSGLRVVERLHQHGILGENSIAVHCVHVDAHEIELLAESRTWVTHQPRSNMNNGVGLPPVESMLNAGVRVCLGNDGFLNAMWEEWKTAYLAHKLWWRDPRRMPGGTVIEMAIHNNARLASAFFPGEPIGYLQPGACADLILVDYHPTTPLNAENLPWHVLFGFHESMVTSTIVAGEVLMWDRELVVLDEERITAQAREAASRTWHRYQKLAPRD
jgi:putative selenium metabolism protein SsnA